MAITESSGKLSNKKLQEKLENYRNLKDEADSIKKKMDLIKEEIGGHLHAVSLNQLDIDLSDGEKWRMVYQTSERASTDLKLLMEYVGAKKYDEIVTMNPSVSLYIRKAPKEKTSSKVNTKPVDDEFKMPTIPRGSVLA